jgi:hypothetical protein
MAEVTYLLSDIILYLCLDPMFSKVLLALVVI